MVDAMRSRRSGRGLAGWVVAAGRRRYPKVTVTARRREAGGQREPAPPLTASAEGKALRKLVLGHSPRPSHVSVPKGRARGGLGPPRRPSAGARDRGISHLGFGTRCGHGLVHRVRELREVLLEHPRQ